ncbi:hypothetical protein EVAR_29063_1 [Eumeta japonica]|uniref:Uncharacterized protein n=1 Tax=Eumeta variegata TaxID=151549 RepID=A0A4C1VMC0_EUMVA|nr:hypothetical protein EVAR_29063_1 [Eumeta japonica]
MQGSQATTVKTSLQERRSQEKDGSAKEYWSNPWSTLNSLNTYIVGRDESDDKSDDFDSFTECGRTAHAVPTARDMRYGRRLVEVVSA